MHHLRTTSRYAASFDPRRHTRLPAHTEGCGTRQPCMQDPTAAADRHSGAAFHQPAPAPTTRAARPPCSATLAFDELLAFALAALGTGLFPAPAEGTRPGATATTSAAGALAALTAKPACGSDRRGQHAATASHYVAVSAMHVHITHAHDSFEAPTCTARSGCCRAGACRRRL